VTNIVQHPQSRQALTHNMGIAASVAGRCNHRL